MMTEAIQQSIDALEAESRTLTERLIDIDQAVTALRKLVSHSKEAAPVDLPAPRPAERHEPQVRTPKVRTTLSMHPNEDRQARLLAAVREQDGLSSSELGRRIGEHTDRAKYTLAQMAKDGLVHRTGTGPRNFRWHLGVRRAGGDKPAKEAPSRA